MAQSHRYIDALESCCELIAENPGIGRRCDSIEPGLRRMEEGKHVIFYKADEGSPDHPHSSCKYGPRTKHDKAKLRVASHTATVNVSSVRVTER